MKPEKEIPEKISILNKQIENDPNNQKLYLQRGRFRLEDSKIEEAFEDFSKVIEIDPKTDKANIVHEFYNNIKRKQVEDLTKEIERDPNKAESFLERGRLYNDLKKYKDAIADFNKALELNIDSKEVYILLADCYFQIRAYEQAYNNYKIALEQTDYSGLDLGNDIAENVENLSNQFYLMKDYDRALELLKNVREFNYQYFNGLNLDETIEKIIKEKANTENDKRIIRIKKNIFQAFSHTISNIIWSDKGIINKIKEGINSQSDIHRLELLHDLMISTMNAIKISFSDQEVINFQIQKDFAYKKASHNISIFNLFYFCLNINLEHLIKADQGWGTTRNYFFKLDENDQDYWNKISYFESIQKSDDFVLATMSDKEIDVFIKYFYSEEFNKVNRFFKIQIDQLKEIFVVKYSYGFSILFIILLEITKNMLRYGSIYEEKKTVF